MNIEILQICDITIAVKFALKTKTKMKIKPGGHKMIISMIILQILILIISIISLIYLICRKRTMECFYVENETLYLNSPFVKKIPLFDIDHIEFYCSHIRNSYRGQIKVHKKNAKVIKRYFQTSKVTLFVTEEMVLDEIQKLTPVLKEYSIPYTVKYL